MSQVKIRLTGLPEDVDRARELLSAIQAMLTTGETTQLRDYGEAAGFRIVEGSHAYPNRNSEMVRVYLTIDTRR